LLCTKVSEEHDASAFKAEVRIVIKFMGDVVLVAGSSHQAQEDRAIRATEGEGKTKAISIQ
jgi:hypothetical protein